MNTSPISHTSGGQRWTVGVLIVGGGGSLSEELRALAASATKGYLARGRDSPEPLFDVPDSPTQPSTSNAPPPPPKAVPRPRSPPSADDEAKKASAKEKRKSNEVARLLNDLTEGSFHHQAARYSSSHAFTSDQCPLWT